MKGHLQISIDAKERIDADVGIDLARQVIEEAFKDARSGKDLTIIFSSIKQDRDELSVQANKALEG